MGNRGLTKEDAFEMMRQAWTDGDEEKFYRLKKNYEALVEWETKALNLIDNIKNKHINGKVEARNGNSMNIYDDIFRDGLPKEDE